MVHNEKFKLEQTQNGQTRTIIFRGIIDEDTNFDAILKITGPFVVNFREVSSINSCGVRNWVNALKSVSDRPVCFEECPPLIVRQMNMVPSFVGHAKVSSVFGAYVCDNCEEEKLTLISNQEFKGGFPDVLPCEACGKGEMEFDGDPRQYFAFAK